MPRNNKHYLFWQLVWSLYWEPPASPLPNLSLTQIGSQLCSIRYTPTIIDNRQIISGFHNLVVDMTNGYRLGWNPWELNHSAINSIVPNATIWSPQKQFIAWEANNEAPKGFIGYKCKKNYSIFHIQYSNRHPNKPTKSRPDSANKS